MAKPMAPSDAELSRLLLAGDEQAFTALYRRHKGPVYRFALLTSGPASIAEESKDAIVERAELPRSPTP